MRSDETFRVSEKQKTPSVSGKKDYQKHSVSWLRKLN